MAIRTSCLFAAALILGAPGSARAAELKLRCANQSSGTTWDVTVDLDRRLADSYPAAITERWISWHDTQQGTYVDFDRASGQLTVRGASSTGGYILRHRCDVR